MTIENQFHPHRFEAALRTAIAAQPIFNLTEAEQATLAHTIANEVKSKFFFFHGDVGLWNEKEYVFVAAPFYALKKAHWRQIRNGLVDSKPQTYVVVAEARKDKHYHFYEIPLPHFTEDIQLDGYSLELTRGLSDRKSRKQNYLQIPRVSNLEGDTGIRLDISFKGYKHRRYPARQTLPYPKMKNLIRHIVFTGTLSAIPQGKRILASINELITTLQADCVEAYRTGWNALVDHLDRRAVEFVEAHNEHRTRDGHSVYDKLRSAPNEKVRGYRETAIGIFSRLGVTYDVLPDYGTEYIRDPDGYYDEIPIPVWQKIDDGLPAIAALELLYPNAEKRWKAILKAGTPPPPMIGHKFASTKFDAEKLAELLALAKPQTAHEWQIMEAIYSELPFANFDDDEPYRDDKNDPGYKSRLDIEFIARTWREAHDMRSWQRFYNELYAKHERQTESPRAEIRRQTGGIKEMVQMMYKNIVLPSALRTDHTYYTSHKTPLYAAFKRRIFDIMNLRHLLQGSAYWHSENINFGGRVSSFGVDIAETWLPLVENVTAPNGVQFVPLTSKADLYAEAAAMHHCVWSYTEKCIMERNHILSVRDSRGWRLSTLQFTEINSDNQIGVKNVQHKSQHDNEPGQLATAAARWLENEINSGSLRPDFKAIQNRRRVLGSDFAQLILGFDYNDLSVCEDVYRLYIPCLPAKLQSSSKSVAGFLRTTGIDQILIEHGFQPPPYPRAPIVEGPPVQPVPN